MVFKNCILPFVLVLLITGKGFSQENRKAGNWQFHSIYQVGLLQGQTGGAFQMQTIDGVQYKSWFLGIGACFDYYRLRSIPLFLDIRKTFGKSRDRFFIYAEGGINFNWITEQQKETYTIYGYKYKNGLYTDAGIGYRIATGKRNALLLNAGYSYKAVSSMAFLISLNGGEDTYRYKMNRFSMKVGFEF